MPEIKRLVCDCGGELFHEGTELCISCGKKLDHSKKLPEPNTNIYFTISQLTENGLKPYA